VNCCQHDRSIFFLFSPSSPSFLFLLVFFTNYCFLGFLHSLFLLHMCMMSLISFVVMANGLSEIIIKLTIWIVIVIISLDNK
jgi:hypothetical protein